MKAETSRREFLGLIGSGVAVGTLAVPLLSACGSSSSPGSAASSSGTGKRGGKLRFAVAGGTPADKTDPALAFTSIPLYISANVYDRLVHADVNYNLTPGLATDWTSTTDAKTWTFKLRPGVTFHNKKQFTSADVAYSLRRILDTKLASPALGNISPFLKSDGIATPDKSTVRFQLTNANAFFAQVLAGLNFAIVPEGTTDFSKPVGTGPFILESFQAGANTSLSRNASYWDGGLPYLDGVSLLSLSEDATRVQSLIGGNVDLIDNISGANIKLLAGQPGVHMIDIKAGGWVDLAAWGDTSPFNNANVVKAMKYAADRDKIMSVVAPNAYSIGPDIPVPASDPFYPAGLKPYPYDPEMAKGLLKQAGYSDGLNLTLYAYEGDKLDAALAYKQTAQPAGINVHVMTGSVTTYYSQVYLKKPFMGDSWARLHASVILQQAFVAQPNEFHWHSAKFDGLVAAATATSDTSRQKTLLGDAITMLNDSVSAVIPGWEPQVYGSSDNLHGVQLSNGAEVDLARAYFA